MASENSNPPIPNGPVVSPRTAGHARQRAEARHSRRRLLRYGLVGAAVVAAAGVGGAAAGPERSGTFYSAARRQSVGYTIAYPPGHRPGARLPLVVMLHGYGGNHTDALSGMSPAQALALRGSGTPLSPMAMVTADGGTGYWNPHPGDNPQAMLTDELIPMCQRLGLGVSGNHVAAHGIGVMGISMGGYGALLLAEKRPDLVGAVAAISPAVWTSYAQARAANAGAYASAADFAADDAVTHAAGLARVKVRVASGLADPFYPGVQALARALPEDPGGEPATVTFANGCHDNSFFTAQVPPSLAFLARQLTVG
jgi:S-formylglutathione hydrolase FrmB